MLMPPVAFVVDVQADEQGSDLLRPGQFVQPHHRDLCEELSTRSHFTCQTAHGDEYGKKPDRLTFSKPETREASC